MSETAVRPPVKAPAVPPVGAARRAQQSPGVLALKKLLAPVASLRVTVVLFALSILLVFFGTLAQVDEGIFTVLKEYFRTGLAWIPLQIFVRFGQVFFGVPASARLEGSFPFPGGWLLGGLLLVNLIAAHAVRFRFTLKRAGVLVLHTGLVILMLSEVVTGVYGTEGRMTIEEGTSANYVEDPHTVELAVILPLDAKKDDVVAVPGPRLEKGGTIRHPDLPFDIDVAEYMRNSNEPKQGSDGPNPATVGDGVKAVVTRRPDEAGTDSRIDIPSAYLTFKKKDSGESLGTYLVSVWLSHPQKVQVGDKTYEVVLRFQRTYEPYSMHLIKFSHDVYPGTDIPRNFSSKVRVMDTERREDREVLISMNSPFQYGRGSLFSLGGETFYQADYLKDGRVGTVLQVVKNPGWILPYISCTMVALGMLIHFSLNLVGFIQRSAAR